MMHHNDPHHIMDLPSLETLQRSRLQSDSPLGIALSLLFESTPVLFAHLEPAISHQLTSIRLTSYTQLVDLCLHEIAEWDSTLVCQFIEGHPRIGEDRNLSKLSAKEQAAAATSPEVLARLVYLNECYECRYGLRYITFVNGRSRAAIAKEMEERLGLSEDCWTAPSEMIQVEARSEEWRAELARAVQDIGLIAKSRLGALEVNTGC